MKKPYDITGKIFGKLEVIEFAFSKNSNAHWACSCSCGGAKVVAACHLKSGHTTSCGCAQKEAVSLASSTHRESVSTGNSREYRAWTRMKQRCYNPKTTRYESWGGRGISVCEQWRDDFQQFLKDMGRCPPK